MQIPILIEKIAGDGYRAKGGEPFAISVEAPTREEAVGKLEQMMQEKLKAGAELAHVDLSPDQDDPWLRMAGIFDKNDPMVQEWLEEVARYREQCNNEPDY